MPAALILHISSQSRSGRRHTQNFPPNFKKPRGGFHTYHRASSTAVPRPRRRFIRADYSRALGLCRADSLSQHQIHPQEEIRAHFVNLCYSTSRRPPREFIPAALFICSHPCSLISMAATGLFIFFLSHSNGIIPQPLPMSQQRLDPFTAAKSASRRALHPESVFLRNDCGYARAEVFELEFVHQMSLFGFSVDILIDPCQKFSASPQGSKGEG